MAPLGEFLSISEEESVYSALKTIRESIHRKSAWKGHRLVIVVNKVNEPTGILTFKNILRAVAIRLMEEDASFKAEFFSWYYIKDLRKNGGVPVRELMRPLDLFSLEYGSSVFKAAHLFFKHGLNYLPVTKDGKVIGILNSRDFFFRYYELAGFKPLQAASLQSGPCLPNQTRQPAGSPGTIAAPAGPGDSPVPLLNNPEYYGR